MIIKVVVSLVLCFTAAFIGSYFTMPSIPTWYASLNKPSFNPPNWIFGPVWTLLYTMMALSVALVWQKGGKISKPVSLFLIQLTLNVGWSIAFFGLHSALMAYIVIVALWFFILWTMVEFYQYSKGAAWLLFPYLLWVTFASVLNLAVVLLNK